jgi:hypothetical protein
MDWMEGVGARTFARPLGGDSIPVSGDGVSMEGYLDDFVRAAKIAHNQATRFRMVEGLRHEATQQDRLRHYMAVARELRTRGIVH